MGAALSSNSASNPSDSLTATSSPSPDSYSKDFTNTSASLTMSKSDSISPESDAKTAANETPEDQASSSLIESRKVEDGGAPRNSGESEKADEDGGEVEGEEGQEEEEEEEGECGFCLFMKGGGCKEGFIAWEQCIEEAEKNKEDIVEKCFQVTSALKKCMEANTDYYEPILRAEKNAEEEAMKQLEEEANDLKQDVADSERTKQIGDSDQKASDVDK